MLMVLALSLEGVGRQKRITKTQIFHHVKMWSSKNPLKETKIIQNMRTL